MPVSCDRVNVTAAALGDNNTRVYAVHLVNNGTTRMVTLTGLPASVKQLQVYTTGKELNMKEGGLVQVKGGVAKFKLAATSFTTLISLKG